MIGATWYHIGSPPRLRRGLCFHSHLRTIEYPIVNKALVSWESPGSLGGLQVAHGARALLIPGAMTGAGT